MTPSLAQMINRADKFHGRCLRAVRDGQRLDSPAWHAGAYRGARTALATLTRWGCFADGGLSERGLSLLAAIDAREAE